jgi:hypothetical protein
MWCAVVCCVRCDVGLLQSAVSVFVMFMSYILHSWAKPFLTRENVPQSFFDIVNAEGADVRSRAPPPRVPACAVALCVLDSG